MDALSFLQSQQSIHNHLPYHIYIVYFYIYIYSILTHSSKSIRCIEGYMWSLIHFEWRYKRPFYTIFWCWCGYWLLELLLLVVSIGCCHCQSQRRLLSNLNSRQFKLRHVSKKITSFNSCQRLSYGVSEAECLSVCLSVCLSAVCLFVCLFVCLPVRPQMC